MRKRPHQEGLSSEHARTLGSSMLTMGAASRPPMRSKWISEQGPQGPVSPISQKLACAQEMDERERSREPSGTPIDANTSVQMKRTNAWRSIIHSRARALMRSEDWTTGQDKRARKNLLVEGQYALSGEKLLPDVPRLRVAVDALATREVRHVQTSLPHRNQIERVQMRVQGAKPQFDGARSRNKWLNSANCHTKRRCRQVDQKQWSRPPHETIPCAVIAGNLFAKNATTAAQWRPDVPDRCRTLL